MIHSDILLVILSLLSLQYTVKCMENAGHERGYISTRTQNKRRAAIVSWSEYQQRLRNRFYSTESASMPARRLPLIPPQRPQPAYSRSNETVPIILSLPPYRLHAQSMKYIVTSEEMPNRLNSQKVSDLLPGAYRINESEKLLPFIRKIPQNFVYSTKADLQKVQSNLNKEKQFLQNAIGQNSVGDTNIQQTVRTVAGSHYPRLGVGNERRSPIKSSLMNSFVPFQQVPTGPYVMGNNIVETGKSVVSFLKSTEALEQISRFASNFLRLPGSGEQKNLISAVTSALTGSDKQIQNGDAAADKFTGISSNIINTQEIFSALSEKNLTKSEEAFNNLTKSEVTNLLKNLPEEQRSLLEAAVQSGELDARSLYSALESLTNETEYSNKNGGRLLEWIQQNRKKPKKLQGTSIISDKLPYYGRYCGSFSTQLNGIHQSSIGGAVWAADTHRLILSKFQFKPKSLVADNITFWIGPAKPSGIFSEDMVPSLNGIYLKPHLINIPPGFFDTIEVIKAKIRSTNGTNEQNEILDLELDEKTRSRRDLFSNLYESQEILSFRSKVQQERINSASNKTVDIMNNMELMDSLLGSNETSNGDFETTFREDEPISGLPTETTTQNIVNKSAEPLIVNVDFKIETEGIEPLGWYAGFQPILLTLPDNKWLNTISWLSLWDHKRMKSLAHILIPNGPAFHIPSIVQLRPLTANGAHEINSGTIKILDIKTIEIENFTLRTNGLAIWFMVGKDILPNSGGTIVPIFNESEQSFDCDSLRDYNSEKVTIRLPGFLDMSDVFWLSVFSMTSGSSLSHIYLPYNDFHLPPDLRSIATPHCMWRK